MRGKQAAGAVRECHRARSAILPILDDLEARPGTAGELLWPMLRPGRHLPVAANGNDPVKPPGGGFLLYISPVLSYCLMNFSICNSITVFRNFLQ